MSEQDRVIHKSSMAALATAIGMVGARKIADSCKVTHQAVYKWRHLGVPESRAPGIESATQGKVRCEDICPGVEWERNGLGVVIAVRIPVSGSTE